MITPESPYIGKIVEKKEKWHFVTVSISSYTGVGYMSSGSTVSTEEAGCVCEKEHTSPT